MSLRIAIAEITGQVGRLLVEEIAAAGDALVGGTARPASAKKPPGGVKIADLDALAPSCDAVIDFTHASLVGPHATVLARHKAVWVLGTSGLTADDEAALRATAQTIPVVYASSFAPTAALVPDLVSTLARGLPVADYDVEILETHHRHKVDAPSGTALAIGRQIAAARGQDFAAVRIPGRDGHVGPRPPGGIGFGAVRAGELVGETAIHFLADDEQIVLTRRVFDRRVYASGALRAAHWAVGKPPGLYGMRDVLAGG